MALALSVLTVDVGESNLYVTGLITPSGSYVSGGDTVDFSTIANSAPVGLPESIAPVQVWVGGTTGDSYGFVAGSGLTNGKVKINTASNTELAAGAYPARITGDTNIQFEATFKKFL